MFTVTACTFIVILRQTLIYFAGKSQNKKKNPSNRKEEFSRWEGEGGAGLVLFRVYVNKHEPGH